jgi:hypothetical protein
LLNANRSINNALLINNIEFSKKMDKNTLKQLVEEKKGAKKGANHRDLL